MCRLDGVYTACMHMEIFLIHLKMYQGKDCIDKLVEYIKDKVKQLYGTFPQQPMKQLIELLKKEHETAEKCHICFKEFNDHENRSL